MIKPLISLAALACAFPLQAQEAPKAPVTPNDVVAAAPANDWVRIPAEDLLVMDLAPDMNGKPRRVVIQLMPAPFSQGWVENIKTLARAHWWDGLSIYRSVDNWVVQWGDGEEEDADRTRPAKPLPEGLNVVPESEYVVSFLADEADQAGHLGLIDSYAEAVGLVRGLPVAQSGDAWWPTHCYASVGVARNLSPDTGTGAELYAVIGHAPRQLDRNIAVVGRVIEGIQHLSVLPRGTGAYGVYETEAEHTPIAQVRLASELQATASGSEATGTQGLPQPVFEYLDTSSESFARYAEVSANRNDDFYKAPAGGIDICNLKVPIRRVPTE